jgi:hypothetical protein
MVELSVLSLDKKLNIKIKKALIFIISAFCFNLSYAQVWELGGGVGTCSYRGDIINIFNL